LEMQYLVVRREYKMLWGNKPTSQAAKPIMSHLCREGKVLRKKMCLVVIQKNLTEYRHDLVQLCRKLY
jgi:hypothetical protein